MANYQRVSVTAMASFSTRLCLLFVCWWREQTIMNNPFLKILDFYPNMTKTSETLPFISYRRRSFLCVLQNICFYLCDFVKEVIHQCMSITELLNINMYTVCLLHKDMMASKMKSMTVEIKDWSEHDAWNKDVKMSTVLDKTVKPQMKVVIQSDLVEVPDFLLSDCLECQSEEQGKRDDNDQTEWSDEDLSSDGVSEMSSENRGLWEFFLNTHDPYNPLHFCSTEDKAKHSDHEEEEEDNVQDPQEQNETELIEEEDSDWSDEDDLEMPAESRVLWESFNSDPYNPLCFSGPTVVKTKTSEIQQDHKPSSPTTGELEENDPEQSTKRCAKKVLFSEKVTIHNLEDWGSASQEARDGSCWMEMARDRARFKRRVENTGEIIRWCLTAEHRAKVLDRLVISSDSVPADQ